MNTKQQLESLDIWLKEAYDQGYKDACDKLSPEHYSVDMIIKHFVEFTREYDKVYNTSNGEINYTDGQRLYSLKEIVNKLKLTYGYDEE